MCGLENEDNEEMDMAYGLPCRGLCHMQYTVVDLL